MSKHTKGPWGVDDNHGKRYIEPISSNDPVAIVCKKVGAEFLANARLIAAAPLMYELLAMKSASGDDDCRRLLAEIGDV